jgi:GntR family transcriptional regulator, transcriptional repressor for pyruvate dehydrogenase complex
MPMTNKSSPHRSPDPRRRDSAPPQRAGVLPTPLKFQPIHVRRTFEEICERIREQLALGVLKPGDKLPRERDLAEQLGVSRNVLKEALRSLEMAGLLRLQKGVKGGAFIQEGDMGRMNDVVRDMLSLGAISVRELSEGRIQILDLIVRLACERAQAGDFQALEVNIERADFATREGRWLDRVECSREFYKLLAAATGNKVMAMIMESVTEIHMRFVYAKVASSGVSMPQLVEKRRQFLSALRARDVSSATRLMRVHLESVQRMLESDPDAMSVHVALAEIQPGARRRAAQRVLTKSG